MAISTNIRSVRTIQSVTGVSFSVEQNRNPALELCAQCAEDAKRAKRSGG